MTAFSKQHDPLAHSPWRTMVPLLQEGRHLPLLAEVARLRAEGQRIFPQQDRIFHALCSTAPDDVRVVILGQDPYHGAGQAMGMAFSVQEGTPCPRSLQNIFKEIRADVYSGKDLPDSNPCLERWARQGVLLLNTVLTVEEGKAHSHARLTAAAKGGSPYSWQDITRSILEAVAHGPQPVAVLLWGNAAAAYAPLFAQGKHVVLTAAHPSPLSASRGFFGCGHFSRVNAWLTQRGEAPIQW